MSFIVGCAFVLTLTGMGCVSDPLWEPGAGPFACGSSTCNGAAEYCQHMPPCASLMPDSGTNTCRAIPDKCTNKANACQCIVNFITSLEGQPPLGANFVIDGGSGCAVFVSCV